jgi:hypothetical protein
VREAGCCGKAPKLAYMYAAADRVAPEQPVSVAGLPPSPFSTECLTEARRDR